MAINFDQDRAGITGINSDINYNQTAFLPDFLKNVFTGNPEDIELGEEGSPIDKAKDALEKNKQKSLPSPEDVLKGNVSFLDLPSNNRTAMAISNYDELFNPRTMSDANQSLYTGIMNQSGIPIDYTDRIRQQNLPGFASQPQYRIRDQLNRDFLQGGLFRDAKKGLGQAKDGFLEDISGLTRGLGSIRDTGMNLFDLAKDKGIDLGRTIASGIGRYALGPIGGILGNILGSVKDTPEQKAMRDFYKNKTGLDNIGRVQSGIMQGYNPVSLFGGVGLNQAIDKRLATILKTEEDKKKKGLKLSQDLIERREKLKELRAQESAASSAALEAQRRGRRPGTGGDGGGIKDSGGSTGGYSYDSGGREGFGYGL